MFLNNDFEKSLVLYYIIAMNKFSNLHSKKLNFILFTIIDYELKGLKKRKKLLW